MSRSVGDVYKELQSLLEGRLKRAAEVTEDPNQQLAEEGERGQEETEEAKALHGDAAVTKDQDPDEAPVVNPPGNVGDTEQEVATTQDVPPESPGHPTNEPLRNTKKAVSEFKEAGKELSQALGKLVDLLSKEPAEEESEEEQEEEEKEEGEKAEDSEAEEAEADKAAEAESASEEEEEDSDKAEAETSETEAGVDETEAGKEAAEAVAAMLVSEEQAKEAAVSAFVENIIKLAQEEADLYADFLDGYVLSQDDETRKAAGIPPVPVDAVVPPIPQGAAVPPPEAVPLEAEEAPEVTAEELVAILKALAEGQEPTTEEARLVKSLLEQAGIDLSALAEAEPEAKEEQPASSEETPEDKLATVVKLLDELKKEI